MMYTCSMGHGLRDFHSLDFRTALDGSDCFWHQCSVQSCRAQLKGRSSNSSLKAGTQCLWKRESIHWEADFKCFTSAGTKMLVATFTDAACCTFGDRQVAHESFLKCRKKSVFPVFVQALRRFVTNSTLLISHIKSLSFSSASKSTRSMEKARRLFAQLLHSCLSVAPC